MRKFLVYLLIISVTGCQTPGLLKKKNHDLFKDPKPIYIYQNKKEQRITTPENEIYIEKIV